MSIKLTSLGSFSSTPSLKTLTFSYATSKGNITQVTSRSSASKRESLKWTISKLAKQHLPGLWHCLQKNCLQQFRLKTRGYWQNKGKLYMRKSTQKFRAGCLPGRRGREWSFQPVVVFVVELQIYTNTSVALQWRHITQPSLFPGLHSKSNPAFLLFFLAVSVTQSGPHLSSLREQLPSFHFQWIDVCI